MYALKNVKTMDGREGLAFSCTIYKDSTKVGYARNDGNGGMTSIDMEGADYPARHAALCELGRWAAANCGGSWTAEYMNDSDEHNAELGIDMLFEAHEALKYLKRHSKTKVLFRLPEDPSDQYRTVAHKGNIPAAQAWVIKTYPTATFWDAASGEWF
jgi:hypothetical protein